MAFNISVIKECYWLDLAVTPWSWEPNVVNDMLDYKRNFALLYSAKTNELITVGGTYAHYYYYYYEEWRTPKVQVYDFKDQKWYDNLYPDFPEMHNHAQGTVTLVDDQYIYVISENKIHFSDVITKSPWKSVSLGDINKKSTGASIFVPNIYGSSSILSLGGKIGQAENSKEVELFTLDASDYEKLEIQRLNDMDFELLRGQAAQLGDDIVFIRTRKSSEAEDIYVWDYANAKLRPVGMLQKRRYFATGLPMPGSLFPECKSKSNGFLS